VGWSKECRRLLSRFEKLAVNYLAFLDHCLLCPVVVIYDPGIEQYRLFNRA
jgi:hypothetical protein